MNLQAVRQNLAQTAQQTLQDAITHPMQTLGIIGAGAGAIWFVGFGGNVKVGAFFDGVNHFIEKDAPANTAEVYEFSSVCSANGGSITAKPRGMHIAVSAQGLHCSLPNKQSLETVRTMFPDARFVESINP
jgi:hypothetical protein